MILSFFLQAKSLVNKITSKTSLIITSFKNRVILPPTLLLVTIFKFPFTDKNLIISITFIPLKSKETFFANPSSNEDPGIAKEDSTISKLNSSAS